MDYRNAGAVRSRTARFRTKNLALAGMVFAVSAIAVLAISAIVFQGPLGEAEGGGTPEVGSELQAALSGLRLQRSAPTGDSPVSAAVAPAVPADGSAEPVSLGSIRIPAIGVDAHYHSGVHDAVVALGPGLWPGTPLPGMLGNSVFAGHRTTHTRPFENIDRLKPGDVIETTSGAGATTDFRVDSIKTVRESEYVAYSLAAPESPESISLTLLACAPKGSRTHRIVVRASAPLAVTPVPRGVMPKAPE